MSAIHMALHNVMKDVGAVKKQGWNDFQKFNFRGVDAVVNSVYPALVEHKVTVQPKVLSYEYDTIEVGQGSGRKPMGHARVIVEYTFTSAEDGSSTSTSAAGEAFDAGDKATPKAMSVALRTAMLQALMLPTDEPDPDTQTYERAVAPAAAPDPFIVARNVVADAWRANRGVFHPAAVEKDFEKWSEGEVFMDAPLARLHEYAEHLAKEQSA